MEPEWALSGSGYAFADPGRAPRASVRGRNRIAQPLERDGDRGALGHVRLGRNRERHAGQPKDPASKRR